MLHIFKSRAKDEKNQTPKVSEIILAALKKGDKSINDFPQFKHQSITSAFSKLEAKGLIFKHGVVQNGRYKYTVYRIETDPNMIEIRKKMIAQDKFLHWVEQGRLKNYFEKWGGLTNE